MSEGRIFISYRSYARADGQRTTERLQEMLEQQKLSWRRDNAEMPTDVVILTVLQRAIEHMDHVGTWPDDPRGSLAP